MRRLLLVEDHAVFRASLARLLERYGRFESVVQARSLAECRELLSRDGAGFGVAVIDIFLPDGDGVELIEELREAYPDARVLVLTISLDPADHARAREAGAEAVISKAAPLRDATDAINDPGAD